MEIRLLGSVDEPLVEGAAHLFDHLPRAEETAHFLCRSDHFFWLATDGDQPLGFLSASLYRHPDKLNEMFVHELGVDPAARRKGVATGLVAAAKAKAREIGCAYMFVFAESDDERAKAFYRSLDSNDEEHAVMFGWEIE